VITGNIALARMLIDKYSVPLDRLRRSRTVLHEAVVNGTLEMTQLLLSAGANPNLLGTSRESYGLNYPFSPPEWTALHFAVGRQLSYRGEAVDPATTEAMVRLLVKHGADIDSMGKRGETPLSLVVSDAVSHVSRARRFDERYRQFRYPPKDPFSGIGIESRRWLARVLLELGADKLVALDNEFVFNFTSNYQVEDIWLVKEHLDAIDAERLGGAEDSTPRFSLMDFTFQ